MAILLNLVKFGRHLYGTSVPLLLHDKQIELVKSAKYLSIYLDCKLSWYEHINELCMQLSKLSGVFHLIASFKSAYRVRQLYYAYVFSHINYGIELYGVASRTNLAKIQLLQNFLLKPLAKRKCRDSATALHRELNIVKVSELYTFNSFIFVYKQHSNLLPCFFNQFY